MQWFADQLGVHQYLGTDMNLGGEIVHVWARDKARWLDKLIGSYDVRPSRSAAVGDSQGDVEMLRAAKLGYLVGKTAVPGLPSAMHLPEADLRAVSSEILRHWAD